MGMKPRRKPYPSEAAARACLDFIELNRCDYCNRIVASITIGDGVSIAQCPAGCPGKLTRQCNDFGEAARAQTAGKAGE